VAYPPGGSYSSAQNVTLESATDGAVIYYTTNGTPPATSSAMYSSPINLSANTLLRAVAVKGGMNNSDVMTENYSITLPAGIEKTASPVAVPPAGTYSGNQLVTLSSATEGAAIYYTTDGSTPTVNSTLYSGTIDVSSAATNLRAVAVKEGMNNSDIMTAIYNITNVNVALPLSHKMAAIPAGTYTMGSPTTDVYRFPDETQHQVTLSAFKMGVYQVTQELYQAVMGTNPSYFHGGSGKEPANGEVQGRRPVEHVSWYDALVFCNKLSVMEELSPA